MQLDQFLNIIGSELHVDTLETCIRRQENTIIEKNERKVSIPQGRNGGGL